MKRIFLFLLTNIAILVVISITLSILGVDSILMNQGTDLDLRALLIFSAVIGFIGSFMSLAMSKWSAKQWTGAKVISSPSNQVETWLIETVAAQSKQVGIGMPEVAIYPSNDINAFATGARRDASLVAVSTGLLNRLGKDEIEAVLAHEVSHVANGDMITLTLIQGIVNTFVIFLSRVVGFFVDRVILKNERGLGLGYYLSSIVAQIVFGILASTIVMWFSRQREFRADEGGAKLAGRSKMINALRALQRAHEPEGLPEPLNAFGISAKKKGGWMRFFMSHPPIEERIEALERL
ncbi:MAG: protease HtpX [Gammaproteobacteria bacterium]